MSDVKPPKKRVNSKAKGSGFENLIAKKLSASLAPLSFIRTQGSGARVGGKNFQTIGQLFGSDALKLFVGDVVPTNERDSNLEFRWNIECKSYATADSFDSIITGKALIYAWLKESSDDAKKINKLPMIIFKWKHTPTYVAWYEKDTPIVGQWQFSLNFESDSVIITTLDNALQNKDFWMQSI